MRRARRVGWLFVAAVAPPVLIVAVDQPMALASCMTTTFPSVEVTGVVVSTSIVPQTGVFVNVQTENGATRTVVFYGRNPNDTLPNGAENTVEDAWPGELPRVGGQYTITGAEFEGADGPVGVSVCAQSPSVALLAAPVSVGDTNATTSEASKPSSDGGGQSAAATIAILIGVVAGIGALVAAVRKRASQSS